MELIPLEHYLIISALLFCIGLYAVFSRRNAILVLIGVEFMLNAAILNLVAFGGHLFAVFAIVLAAATVAVALAIIMNVYSHYKTIDPEKIKDLKY